MKSGKYLLNLSPDCIIDIATIDDKSWSSIKKNVRHFMNTKEFSDIGKAYIAAFFIYVEEIDLLIPEFDPRFDKFM